MANLPEASTFDAGVYQLETTDPVVGGANGVSNTPLKNLANRTKYLKDRVDALSGSMHGLLLKQTVFTNSGTWTPNASTTMVEVIVIGGGGSGGGAVATGSGGYSLGSGGSAGGFVSKLFLTNPGAQSITVGSGGAGVVLGTYPTLYTTPGGTNGGASSFGTLLSAAGGSQGISYTQALVYPQTAYLGAYQGGVAVGGDLNIQGEAGGVGWLLTSVGNGTAGVGGSSVFGMGGSPGLNGNAGNGTGYGAGGGGCENGPNTASQKGGNGAPGVVIVREYA